MGAKGIDRQKIRTMVALIEEVDRALPLDSTIEWIGFLVVTDKILGEIKIVIRAIDGAWLPPDTVVKTEIAQVVKKAGVVQETEGILNQK